MFWSLEFTDGTADEIETQQDLMYFYLAFFVIIKHPEFERNHKDHWTLPPWLQEFSAVFRLAL